MATLRTPLGNRSNFTFTAARTPAKLPPPASPERPRKRQRLADQENKGTVTLKSPKSGKEKPKAAQEQWLITELPEEPPRRRALPNFRRLASGMTSTHSLSAYLPLSLPTIRSMVSSHTTDVYKFHSDNFSAYHDTPTVCAFSHRSKGLDAGTRLAVCTNEGKVQIINTAARGPGEPEIPRTCFQSNPGAIFDVQWNNDDSRIAIASGDHSCRVFDVETEAEIAHLSGAHLSGVKQAHWCPGNPNILASGARDGAIYLWDLRERIGESYGPVLSIPKAHEPSKVKGRGNRERSSGVMAITGLLYDQYRQNYLYSCSTYNGVVQLWDLRQNRGAASPAGSSFDTTTLAGSISGSSPKRARGISSMVMDPTGSYIYSVSADSRIHRHSAVTLSTLSSPTPLSDPRMRVGSFHVRASISPCGEYLASGSTGGQVFVWSLRDPTQVAVVLQATGDEFAERETASVDWAADGSLAACSDDGTLRIWRQDVAKAQWIRESGDRQAYDWVVAA